MINQMNQEDAPVMVDKLRIQQILINLIQNAIKFSKEDDTILIEIVRLKFDLEASTQPTYKIMVTDQGPGISEEDQVNLFSKYFKSNKQMGKETHGLGLNICK